MTETTEHTNKETLGFQTEVSQLLDLVIHSLYSNKEIFLRELISNASDAADKLRFEALKDESLYEGDGDLKIRLSYDKEAGTITISDNGIGMSRDELTEHLGTIAKSGTKHFFESLTGDQTKDSQLIGQFGVGFYSSFIVADKVTVISRRAGLPASEGASWESDGKGEYTLDTVEKANRGTDIILHLNEDQKDFADGYRLRTVVRKFSDHISLPIIMQKEELPTDEDGKEIEGATPEDETVNKATALWARSKAEISEEEYNEFYKHVSHDFEDPLAHVHSKVEGKLEYSSLLYIPKRAPFDMFDRQQKHGVKLYVQRVFIMDDAEQLLPGYLRFVKGVIDSNDLPLNISREILQQNSQIDSMRTGSVKKILGLLENLAKNDVEKYQAFWSEFGLVLKEGLIDDFANKDRIAGLCRFASTRNEDDTQNVSLDDYIERMQDDQEAIYYITAENYASAKNSPHMEIFEHKGIEVLLLTDPVDEWVVTHLDNFKEKPLKSIMKGDLDFDKKEDTEDEDKKDEENENPLISRITAALGDTVTSVRVSKRLTTSPACLVSGEQSMGAHMEKLLKAAGQHVPESKPDLEINAEHPLLKRMETEQDEERFKDWSHILFDQARLSEGGKLDDPAAFVKRLNSMLLDLTAD